MKAKWRGLWSLAVVGVVAVASVSAIAAPATQPPAAPAVRSEDRSVAVQLRRKLPEVKFDGVALGDALAFLQDFTGLALDVKWDVLQAAGIGKETPLTSRLYNVKMSKALQIVLDAAGNGRAKLHYEAVDGVDGAKVIVTTLDDYVAHNTEDREYDIRDLLGNVPDKPSDSATKGRAQLVEEVSKLITETVAAESWADAHGKPGVIREKDGRLIITQTKENHPQIKNVIEQLRETRGGCGAERPRTQPTEPPRP